MPENKPEEHVHTKACDTDRNIRHKCTHGLPAYEGCYACGYRFGG